MKCSMRSSARSVGLRMTERSVGEFHGAVEAPEGSADEHHRVMVSATRVSGLREQEGWCLPASLDTVELRDQRSRTRGRVDICDGVEWVVQSAPPVTTTLDDPRATQEPAVPPAWSEIEAESKAVRMWPIIPSSRTAEAVEGNFKLRFQHHHSVVF